MLSCGDTRVGLQGGTSVRGQEEEESRGHSYSYYYWSLTKWKGDLIALPGWSACCVP